jgi:transposase
MQGTAGFTQVGQILYKKRNVEYSIVPQPRMIRCPCCGSTNVVKRGSVTRRIQGVPVETKKYIYLNVEVPRVQCKKCDALRQIELGFAEPRKRYTKCFAKETVLLVMATSIESAARRMRVSWHTVNDIIQSYITKKYSKTKLKGVVRIGIDETYIGKTKKYITIVVNLDTGEPIFVGKGKGEDALVPFWELLGKRKKNIQAVAIDMGAAFQKAVRDNIPQAVMVFDHFHVVKLMNDRIDQMRRSVFRNATDTEKDVIKGCRYLLLKNEDNLDSFRNEKERLDRLLKLNTPLTKGYILKESLKQVWKQDSHEKGKACLEEWIAQANESMVGHLMMMARTLQKYSEGILNYYRHCITTACLEGLNTKVKALIRRAYGFRNLGNLINLILAVREFNPLKLLAPG